MQAYWRLHCPHACRKFLLMPVLFLTMFCFVVLQLNKNEHNEFLCILSIMTIVIWTTRQKKFYGGQKFSFQLILKSKSRREERKSLHRNSARDGWLFRDWFAWMLLLAACWGRLGKKGFASLTVYHTIL